MYNNIVVTCTTCTDVVKLEHIYIDTELFRMVLKCKVLKLVKVKPFCSAPQFPAHESQWHIFDTTAQGQEQNCVCDQAVISVK